MSTSEHSKQGLIEVCYCSPNLAQDYCDYCMAMSEVSKILDTPVPEFLANEAAKEQEIETTFEYYNISSKGKMNIIFKLEEEEFHRL